MARMTHRISIFATAGKVLGSLSPSGRDFAVPSDAAEGPILDPTVIPLDPH